MDEIRKKKILHVLEASTGGTKRHVVSIVKNTPFLHEVILSPLRKYYSKEDFRSLCNVKEVKIRRFPGFSDFSAAKIVLDHILSSNPNVVHFHSTKAIIIGFLIRMFFYRKLRGKKVIFVASPHGVYSLNFSSVLRKILDLLFSFVLNKFDYVISVSDSEGDYIRNMLHIDARKAKVIPNGYDGRLDDKKLSNVLSKRLYDIENNRFSFFNVSEFRKQKDFDMYFRIVKEVSEIEKAKGTKVGFLVLSSDYKRILEMFQNKMNLEDPTFFRCFNYGSSLDKYYSDLNCYINTSRFEGFSYSVIDSMAHLELLFLRDSLGNQDLIRNGCAIGFKDEKEFSRKLNDFICLDKDKRKYVLLRFLKKEKDLIMTKYSMKSFVDRYTEFYSKCA